MKALRIKRQADIDKVLTQAREHDGPVLIDAVTVKEDNVFPMVPAGAPLSEVLTEKPKGPMAKPTGST